MTIAGKRIIAGLKQAVEHQRSLCRVPPPGWWCSRESGHEGPCAARPIRPALPLCDALCQRFDDEPDFLGMEAAATIEVLYEAGDALANFAWSCVQTDCAASREHLQGLVNNLRLALAASGNAQKVQP